jgi:MFS family permease
MAEVQKRPLLSGLLILFLAAMIFANIGGNMYGSLMPLYLKDLGSSIPQIGLFFTISQIVPLFLQILGGWVSDTLGRLRAIAIGSVFGVIGFMSRCAGGFMGLARDGSCDRFGGARVGGTQLRRVHRGTFQ